MKHIARLFDFFFVLRPTLFFPVWTVFAAGYFVHQEVALKWCGERAGGNGHLPENVPPLLVGLLLTLLMGGVFVLNQLHDVATDRQNRKLFLIAHGHISPFAAKAEAFLLLAVAMAATGALGFVWGLLFLAILVLAGLLYNFRPFSWKDRPWLGLLANALGACLIFAVGWRASASAGGEALLMLVHAVPYVAAVAAVYLYTTLLDAEGDRLTTKMTFAVKYGLNATTIAGAFLEIIALAAAWALKDRIMLYPALLSAPFFLLAAMRRKDVDIHRAIKLPILFLAIAICFQAVEYLLLLLFVFFFSKWYYRYRFGIVYPSLTAPIQDR